MAKSTKTHAHSATIAVGKHTSEATRKIKLAVGARSLRGINRNLRLTGHPTLKVAKGKAKGTFVVLSGRKSTVVSFDGSPVKSVKSLTYGQWVQAAVSSTK